MAFNKEPDGYEKTLLSDLQGSWQNLRDAVVEHAGFGGWQRVLLHIDEGMSWESVRNLRYMSQCLLPVRNLLMQGEAPDEVAFWLEDVSRLMDKTLRALGKSEINSSVALGINTLDKEHGVSTPIHFRPEDRAGESGKVSRDAGLTDFRRSGEGRFPLSD
jgi:hypothetical protein